MVMITVSLNKEDKETLVLAAALKYNGAPRMLSNFVISAAIKEAKIVIQEFKSKNLERVQV